MSPRRQRCSAEIGKLEGVVKCEYAGDWSGASRCRSLAIWKRGEVIVVFEQCLGDVSVFTKWYREYQGRCMILCSGSGTLTMASMWLVLRVVDGVGSSNLKCWL